MINISITDYEVLIAFWLAFTRWIGIMIQLPIFDEISIPAVAKALGVLVITYAFFPFVQSQLILDIRYLGIEHFWTLTLFHGVVGLVIGMLVKSIMGIFVSAGSVITQQIGFSAVRYFDPNVGQQIGPFEKLIHWTLLIVILSSGALFPMFKGAATSFFTIHIYDWSKLAHSTEYFLHLFKSIFSSAIMLASPLIFVNLLIMSILGVIARTVPQMNVLMVSFVVNIGMGLLVFGATSNEFFQSAFRAYTEKLGEWFQFIT